MILVDCFSTAFVMCEVIKICLNPSLFQGFYFPLLLSFLLFRRIFMTSHITLYCASIIYLTVLISATGSLPSWTRSLRTTQWFTTIILFIPIPSSWMIPVTASFISLNTIQSMNRHRTYKEVTEMLDHVITESDDLQKSFASHSWV